MRKVYQMMVMVWHILCIMVIDVIKFSGGFIGQVTVTAAVALAGIDIFREKPWRVSSKRRVLRGIAVAGSTAAGDCSFNLYIDQYHVGEFFVSAAGWPTRDHIIPLNNNNVPRGATVAAIMVTAPTANPINVILY